MCKRIQNLKVYSKDIEYSVCAWAKRYDERMDMVMSQSEPDLRQKYLTQRLFKRDEYVDLIKSIEEQMEWG